MKSSKDGKPPLVFICPLSKSYIIYPVRIDGSGQIYEREAIESYIHRVGKDPVSGDVASVENLITDEPLFLVIRKILRDFKNGGNTVNGIYDIDNVWKYFALLEWFRNPSQSHLLVNRMNLSSDDESFAVGLEESVSEEDVPEDVEDEEESDEDIEDILEYAKFPPFCERIGNINFFLSRFGPLKRNILHLAVIYLGADHLRLFIEHMERFLFVFEKKSNEFDSLESIKGCVNISVSDFIVQRDCFNRTPLEYSVLQEDSYEKFSVFVRYFKNCKETLERKQSILGISPFPSEKGITNNFKNKKMFFLEPHYAPFMMVKKSVHLDYSSLAKYQSCAANCAKIGDMDGILLLFRLGVRPNDKFETLFHLEVAAGFENVKMLEFMLSYGVYLKERNELSNMDMRYASNDAFCASAANGLIEPAKVLVRFGNVDVNRKCKNFRRYCSFSLSAACFYGHVDFVVFLLSLKKSKKIKVELDLNQVFLGSCSINSACATTQPVNEIVKLLLQSGCNPNPDMAKVCETPLMIASKRNHTALLEMLISKGANINTQTENKKNTALHMALTYRNYEAVKVLIRNYANMDLLNSSGETSRELISRNGSMNKFVTKCLRTRQRKEREKIAKNSSSSVPQQINQLKKIIVSQQKKIEKQKNQIQGFQKLISNFVIEK